MRADSASKKVHRSLFLARRYVIFFLLISFVVTSSFLLFLHTLGITITDMRSSAVITFCNVMFLSLLFTLCDSVRHIYMVERPMERILQATQRLTQGDFSARIQPLHGLELMNEFDVIIADFNKMAEELSSIETLRTDFIASVSHELKTPLAVMQNYATMLQAPNLTEAQRVEYTRAIADASRRLSELITNILRLNKLENQNIPMKKTKYRLDEQIRQALLSLESKWTQKKIGFQVEMEAVKYVGNEGLFMHVWINLLDNAIKFSPNQGIITMFLKQEKDQVKFILEDEGPGIDEEIKNRIFDKFYQADGSHKAEGNGLGLALVKRIIDSAGGTIEAQNREYGGCRFVVQLPLQ